MDTFNEDMFKCYAAFLEKRLQPEVHLTEDSVRYSFFVAALETKKIEQHEIILELPHPGPDPAFMRKKIDTYVVPVSGRVAHYIEFKFHRQFKGATPRPQKAGALFKDFGRLAPLAADSSRCLVIYLTDKEMADYFDNQKVAYSDFWALGEGGTFNYDEGFVSKTCETCQREIGAIHPAQIKVVYKPAVIQGDFHLRVFEVKRQEGN